MPRSGSSCRLRASWRSARRLSAKRSASASWKPPSGRPRPKSGAPRNRRASAARLRRRALYLVGALLLALVMAGVATVFANRSSSLAAQNADNAALANNQRATAEAARGQAETARGEAETARGQAVQLVDLRSRDAQLSQSLALAAQSKLSLQANNLDQALALAWEANQIPNPPGRAQMALSEAAYAPGTMRVFLGHEATVESVAVSPDGRYGLSGDDKGVIFLWDLETGKALRRLEGHTDIVTSVAFTPDGRHAVSGSQDKTLIYLGSRAGDDRPPHDRSPGRGQ